MATVRVGGEREWAEALSQVEFWGQATLRFRFESATVLTDPYLTDYVAEQEGPQLRRLRPAPVAPTAVRGIDWILVSHDHIDHCDPTTLIPVLRGNPEARVMGPSPVIQLLADEGIDDAQLALAKLEWIELAPGVRVRAVPACHPTIDLDESGLPRQIGYVIEGDGRRYYFAGDTSVHEGIVQALRSLGPVDVACLPVNEKNYYRDRQGILGNMSIREAFHMAEEIGARCVLPIHWDMFAPNLVYPEEIRAVYDQMKPTFHLEIPAEVQ